MAVVSFVQEVSGWRRHWRRFVVVFVLFHAAAVALVACPAPVRGENRKIYDRPSVQHELSGWCDRFAFFGVTVTPTELADFAWSTSKRWNGIRNTTIGPLIQYLKTIGSTQGWYMFTSSDSRPVTFEFWGLPNGEVAGSANAVPLAGLTLNDGIWKTSPLSDHRMRRALFMAAWADTPKSSQDICKRLFVSYEEHRESGEVLPIFPSVECRFIETRVLSPEEHRNHAVAARKPLRSVVVP
jgi:hypothetical protein